METIEKVMIDIYDNRLSYKENDYIEICNILKDSYNKIKGIPLTNYKCKGADGSRSSNFDDGEAPSDSLDYSSPYLPDYSGSYLDDY
tara:strand:+ start:235 stop:495 length:261 start_codon:yes stop_codon:yes gene_type:complete